MPNLSLFESVLISLDLIKNYYDSMTNKTVTMKLGTLKPYAFFTMNTTYEHCL